MSKKTKAKIAKLEAEIAAVKGPHAIPVGSIIDLKVQVLELRIQVALLTERVDDLEGVGEDEDEEMSEKSAGPIEPPTLEQVIAAGYPAETAQAIVDREAKKAAAGYPPYGTNPEPAPAPAAPATPAAPAAPAAAGSGTIDPAAGSAGTADPAAGSAVTPDPAAGASAS
jgi:hypothetical protein